MQKKKMIINMFQTTDKSMELKQMLTLETVKPQTHYLQTNKKAHSSRNTFLLKIVR